MGFNIVNNCMNFTTESELNEFTKNIESMIINISYRDFSNASEPANYWIMPSIKIGLYAFLILIALAGNLLVVTVICYNKFLRNTTNYFILNLAICDLAIVLSCMWVQIFNILSEQWLLGEIFCKINSYMQVVSIIASVLTLSAIAYDRYLGVAYPFKTRDDSNKTNYLIIISIWIFSIIIAIPSFLYRTYREQKWLDFNVKTCDDFGWPYKLSKDANGCVVKTHPTKRIYYTLIILLLFFLPILIMSITYSIIIRKLRENHVIGEVFPEKRKSLIKRRKKVVMMLIWVFAIFFICWAPLETMLLFMEYTLKFPQLWSDLEWISYFLAYSNTAINPIIYAGLNENFQLGIKRLKIRMTNKRSYNENNPQISFLVDENRILIRRSKKTKNNL